jgi:phenylacetaldehyde dehydrogenase
MNSVVKITGLSKSAIAFLERKKQLLINGEWVDAIEGGSFPCIDPATEKEVCRIPEGSVADINKAVAAARKAFDDSAWSLMSPYQRQQLLLKLADLMEENAQELAELEALDVGKVLMFARMIDVDSTIEYLRYMAGWATKIDGRTLDVSLQLPPDADAKFQAYTLRQPIGVCGQIIPWNFPLSMAVWKLSPALAAGNTCVLKPAEQTCLTALRLGELILEAGFPPGVVNIVTGYGDTAGKRLVEHPDVNKIAFTGSTPTGKLIGKSAMDTMKRISLELGGKSPVIVLDDANVEQVISGAANAIFFNQGEVCTAGSRLYVQRGNYDAVVAGLVAVAESFTLGSGLDPETNLGPLVSQEQMDRVLGFIETGKKEGGIVNTGGDRAKDKGYFVQPTVFTNCKQDSTIVKNEIFGPVVIVTPFDTIEEVVAMANDSEFGLAASIWSQNLSAVHRLVRRINAGTVWVNTHNMIDPNLPFGGFKQSGIGREMGIDAIHMYTETKSVLMQI